MKLQQRFRFAVSSSLLIALFVIWKCLALSGDTLGSFHNILSSFPNWYIAVVLTLFSVNVVQYYNYFSLAFRLRSNCQFSKNGFMVIVGDSIFSSKYSQEYCSIRILKNNECFQKITHINRFPESDLDLRNPGNTMITFNSDGIPSALEIRTDSKSWSSHKWDGSVFSGLSEDDIATLLKALKSYELNGSSDLKDDLETLKVKNEE